MDYFPEGDLGAYLRKERSLPENEARQIVSQVLQGLAIMHREKYAHRDIKPENILIYQRPVPGGSQLWWVKLTDFGLTKALTRAATSVSAAMGTPGYVAPELLQNFAADDSGHPGHIDYFAADVWSLGATAFHILTATLPFKGYRDIFEYSRSSDLFPHAQLNQHLVSQDGHEFVRVLLAARPNERPKLEAARSHPWVLPHASEAVDYGE